MKNILFIVVILSLCFIDLTLSGCHGKVGADGTELTLDEAEEAVRDNIDELAKAVWDKNNYLEILERQIPELENEDTRESLTKRLNNAYATVLVKEGNRLMNNNGCSPNHKRLTAVMTELNRNPFKTAEGANTLISRNATHNAAIQFAKNISTTAKASTWQSSYDTSYENQVKRQAKSHVSKNPKCNYIKNALSESALKQKFTQRRRNFCNSLVNRFEDSGQHSVKEGQSLISKIKGIQGSCTMAMENRIMSCTTSPNLPY